MLQLRPNCELCDADLPPAARNARICTYECTFCAECVNNILENVCPNCGGGFVARPIRPSQEYRSGVSLNQQPASVERVHTKYSTDEIRDFAAGLKARAPHER